MSTLDGGQLRAAARRGLPVRALVTFPDADSRSILVHLDPTDELGLQYVEDFELQLARIGDDELAIFAGDKIDGDVAIAIFGLDGVDYPR